MLIVNTYHHIEDRVAYFERVADALSEGGRVAIIDYNRFQAAGSVDDVVPLDPLADKWRSFRWNVQEIDGHDMTAIVAALDTVPAAQGPTAIIAHTVKGKGVPGIEGTSRAHFTMLSEEEAQRTLESLA